MVAGRTPAHLGPHVVGVRVVVRRRVPGETGPTGGPALTDVLGTCESWTPAADGTHARVVVRREDGGLVEIDSRDIVSGKPVPPRPSRHRHLSPADADRRAARGWPAAEVEPLAPGGGWELRAAGGFSSRANSVLAVGDPGLPLEQAVARVGSWYSSRGLLPRAHVLGGEHTEPATVRAFAAAGWSAYEETLLMLAPVPRVLRALHARALDPGDGQVRHATTVGAAWLATDERAARFGPAARRVLEGGDVDLVTVHDPSGGAVVARGRASLDGDWVGISCLWTAPDRRRTGLGGVVLAELLDRAAEQGATTAYLQVVVGNASARATYEARGFEVHHQYDYLRAPEQAPT
ncbi:MAG: family N-acetyltransferase [Marmoricola sp.]|nr:family N-acetyltransferase [Marmoricola sp.]